MRLVDPRADAYTSRMLIDAKHVTRGGKPAIILTSDTARITLVLDDKKVTPAQLDAFVEFGRSVNKLFTTHPTGG